MRSLIAVALIVAVSALAGYGAQWQDANASGPTCDQSYPVLSAFAGHWTGTWENHTFQSNGNLTLDAVINENCTASATVTGIYDVTGPHTVNATYRDEGVNIVIEVQNDSLFGDLLVTVAPNGSLTVEGSGAQQDIATVDATGTVEPGHIEVDLTFQFGAGGSATESIELTQDATPTPTVSPTPEPTPTPTATPESEVVVWADWNCSGTPDPVDALLNLRHDAGLGTNTGECPGMGTSVNLLVASVLLWGDADCSGAADPIDALKELRFDAGLSVATGEGCPEMGSEVSVVAP